MNIGPVAIKLLLEKINTISFFQRLFSWGKVRRQITEAAGELSRLFTELETLNEANIQLTKQLSECRKDLDLASNQKIRLEEVQKQHAELVTAKDNTISDLDKKFTAAITNLKNTESQLLELNKVLDLLKERKDALQRKFDEVNEEYIKMQEKETARSREYVTALATLTKITDQIQAERNREIEQRQELDIERLKKMKDTWAEHQSNVKNNIKTICNKHAIEYVEKVPFKGEPDNAIRICDELIIFDAKSPAGDDFSNFYNYLKDQAEKAKKYARQENVKPDIFLVVPNNVFDVIRQTTFPLADFSVFVISTDSLEPIILSLKKLEAYEFAQQLSPEERENICRVIGKFAHLTKRRIQIDSFFARQFIELVYKCENSLPDDILEKVSEFERSEKLNPPMEKRAKAINTALLDIDITKLETEAETKGIQMQDMSEQLNIIRLYKEDNK
jgi:hypothetical protein